MMTDICIFKGYLGTKPGIAKTPSGIDVVNVSLAIDKSYYDKKNNWINKVAWRDLVFWDAHARRVAEKAYKGALLLVETVSDDNVYEKGGQTIRKPFFKVKSFDILIPENLLDKAINHLIDTEAEKMLQLEEATKGIYNTLDQVPEQ